MKYGPFVRVKRLPTFFSEHLNSVRLQDGGAHGLEYFGSKIRIAVALSPFLTTFSYRHYRIILHSRQKYGTSARSVKTN